MRVAIGVITRRRPEGLSRLLASIDALDGIDAPGSGPEASHVIVVENDEASAIRHPLRCRVPIRYALEPRAGIPCARNRAIAEALALDPPADWLA
ncbi:MAG: hypothetical protein EBU31_15635, partial [Proteobacteria bacterium]|nr:hypothetical protein [Pseudomonadota bacterium]